ncbi:PD-(D/E)XK nuclease domain-containing protein [Aureisphaera galaxeae]|uniref:PD-(D/E)XK nuclease domain-containing protein n=1 Tax=Aureisphaera galaxeae TaxID=1538023 RepID=UPI0023507BCC|nr:PD-(D/E)XK nuclease domain-containing protein [Aureisphaera galaxeae]MDC8003850.1 PD-(D/E)XK nuclease domain-containing protein [Aureisphaera galaxeae]
MKKIKVIWVDDDITLLNKSEYLFNEYGFDIIKCSTISEALKQVLSGFSDNILLDVDFPGNPKEGILFLEQLGKINPNLKIILFTAYPEMNDKVRLLRDNLALDYLSKPLPLNECEVVDFFHRLRRSFNHHSSELNHFKRDKLDILKYSLEENDMDKFINTFRSIFAGLSYNIKVQESYFHGYIQIILDLIGMKIYSELETNNGRIDAVIEVQKYIYIMEFKLRDSNEALSQIKEKKYYERFLLSTKEIVLVGVAFDTKSRNVKDYKIEILEE